MKITKTKLPGVLIIEPDVFKDSRGCFYESYQVQRFKELGISLEFVQDNHSCSSYGVLRGLHFQVKHPQGKLVGVNVGSVFDVVVDINKNSATYGQYTSIELTEENHKQVYVPPGYAHGFCVTSKSAHFYYKCTDYYNLGDEGGIIWNDPDIGIDWPISSPTISDKDAKLPLLKDACK